MDKLNTNRKEILPLLLFIFITLIGVYFRTSGLFRGLGAQGNIFHPDEPKQIMALLNFLNGEYVRYYGSLFYDGYPYGLNHLDEYIIRPILFFFQAEPPEHHSLYFIARLLRLIYSCGVMFLVYKLVVRLVQCKKMGLMALLFVCLSPLAISVTHFATGDIGVDLFTVLCLLFLLNYIEKANKPIWLLLCGMTVGGAFSAKYNGLLIGLIPFMVVVGEFLHQRQFTALVKNLFLLGIGALAGLLIFTPNILLDFKTALGNIYWNFVFIKNYNVPDDILTQPWIQKALLGIQNNTNYIISALGYAAAALCLLGTFIFGRQAFKHSVSHYNDTECSKNLFLFSLAVFPIIALAVSLSGKYVVQPFHFSYLQLPLILVSSILLHMLLNADNFLQRVFGIILAVIIAAEFGFQSWSENFFWRLEDNGYHAANLPASLYDSEAFYSHRSDPIRSLYLEDSGTSVFRNHSIIAKGPDASFWNTISTAPLPQVANPVGKNWIFLNGPSFPRNERMLIVQAENRGKSVKRYLVLPENQSISAIGLQSGSFATSAEITLGTEKFSANLEAHQQKLLPIPSTAAYTAKKENDTVRIIPFEISVPHDTLWASLLLNQKEVEMFTIFGGGQTGVIAPPEPLEGELQNNFLDAVSRVKFLELDVYWRILPGKRVPMWEVGLPAGRYTLIAEIDGLDESAGELTIEFEDAKGGESLRGKSQTFMMKKGVQRVHFSFTKGFAPFQTRFIMHSQKGRYQFSSLKIFPDYQALLKDFSQWRKTGAQPEWAARYIH